MKHTIISAALALATTSAAYAAVPTAYDDIQDQHLRDIGADTVRASQINSDQDAALAGIVHTQSGHTIAIGNNTVRVQQETAERTSADADLQKQVDSKVDTSTYRNDLWRTRAEIDQNTAAIDKNTQAINTQGTSIYNNEQKIIDARGQIDRNIVAIKDNEQRIKANNASIGRETAERIAGDTANQMKAEDAQNTARDAIVMGTANAQSIANNESHITTVEAKADDAQATAQGNARMLSQTTNSRYQSMKVTEPAKEAIDGKNGLDGAQGATGQNGVDGKDGVTTVVTKHEVDATTKKAVATNTQNIDLIRGDVVTHSHAAYTQATTDSNAYTNQKFSQLKSTVDDNKKEASAGISGAMAMASIPQVLQSQDVAVGAGVGGYDSESAIAVGVSFRASESVTVKTAVSDDTQNNFGYGAGVSFGW